MDAISRWVPNQVFSFSPENTLNPQTNLSLDQAPGLPPELSMVADFIKHFGKPLRPIYQLAERFAEKAPNVAKSYPPSQITTPESQGAKSSGPTAWELFLSALSAPFGCGVKSTEDSKATKSETTGSPKPVSTQGIIEVKNVLAVLSITFPQAKFKLGYPKPPSHKFGMDMELIQDLAKQGPIVVDIQFNNDWTVKSAKANNEEINQLAQRNFSFPDEDIAQVYLLAKLLRGKDLLPVEENYVLALKGYIGDDEQSSTEAMALMKKYFQTMVLQIIGHTNSDGTDADNQKLSERRAEFVKALLLVFGVDPARLQTKGFGEKHPKLLEDVGRPQQRLDAKRANNRVEFRIFSMEGANQVPVK